MKMLRMTYSPSITMMVLSAIALSACSGGASDDTDKTASSDKIETSGKAGSTGPQFASDISPILRKNCAVCHLTGTEAGNLALPPKQAYENLVNVASVVNAKLMRVVPGDADNSYLLAKLEGRQIAMGGQGVQMPFGAVPLAETDIALIREWIAAGAKND